MHDLSGNIAAYAGAVVAVGAAVEVLRRLARGGFRAYRRMIAAVDHVAEVHDVVVRELMPNGGGSLVDRVGKLEEWRVECQGEVPATAPTATAVVVVPQPVAAEG